MKVGLNTECIPAKAYSYRLRYKNVIFCAKLGTKALLDIATL